MSVRFPKGLTIAQQAAIAAEQSAHANDSAGKKKPKKETGLEYCVDFGRNSECGCGRSIGSIGYRLRGMIVCYQCARDSKL